MSEATIEVTGLRKRFGHTVALDGMTFTVNPGRVTAFIGLNGAGKSTTMRVTLGLDRADERTMFAATPSQSAALAQGLASSSVSGGAIAATAVFDKPELQGAWSAPAWSGTAVHSATDNTAGSGFQQTGTAYTVTGSGDIAPYVDTGGTPGQLLTGGFAALIVLTVLGVRAPHHPPSPPPTRDNHETETT